MLGLSERVALVLIAYSAAWVIVCFALYVIADKTGSREMAEFAGRFARVSRKPADAVVLVLEAVVAVIALMAMGVIALLPIVAAMAIISAMRG